MTPEDFARQQDELIASRELLRDVLAYLERLPPVPVTREFCKKLRGRLDSPVHVQAATLRRELYGRGPYTPAGIPLLEASLGEDNVLSVALPKGVSGSTREFALREIVGQLSQHAMQLTMHERIAGTEHRPRSRPQ